MILKYVKLSNANEKKSGIPLDSRDINVELEQPRRGTITFLTSIRLNNTWESTLLPGQCHRHLMRQIALMTLKMIKIDLNRNAPPRPMLWAEVVVWRIWEWQSTALGSLGSETSYCSSESTVTAMYRDGIKIIPSSVSGFAVFASKWPEALWKWPRWIDWMRLDSNGEWLSRDARSILKSLWWINGSQTFGFLHPSRVVLESALFQLLIASCASGFAGNEGKLMLENGRWKSRKSWTQSDSNGN